MDSRKRELVEFGVSVGQRHLISGVEFLRSREIDALIIKRVLLALLARRLATQSLHEPDNRYLQDTAP